MNKDKLILAIILLVTVSVFFSCISETDSPFKLHQDYFASEVGHYVIYDVDSIVYDDFTQTIDTFNYQVKEYIEDEYIDSDLAPSLRLERHIRQTDEDDWQIKNIWKARISDTKALKTEENITYIKLVFPPELNKTWDGNAYNIEDQQDYTYSDIHIPYFLNGNDFDSTVVVLQKDFKTLISEDYQVEVFAKNIGLIFKHFIELTKEPDGTIKRGVDYSYSYVQHGSE